MATNDQLRTAINLLVDASQHLPDGYTITLQVGRTPEEDYDRVPAARQHYGKKHHAGRIWSALVVERADVYDQVIKAGGTLGYHGDRWGSAISAAVADAKR